MKDQATVRAVLASLGVMAGAGWIVFEPGLAQAQIAKNNQPAVVNVFLPAPREAKQRLTQAREALDDQRYADAVDNLDKLLRDPEAEDFFTGSSTEDKAQPSIKWEALRMLGSMPKKGREVYELSFGAEARKLLDEAVTEGSLSKLVEVTRMFFHTKAGYEATLLLGRHHLDRGRPLAGALCLARMAEVPAAADEFDPELSLLLSACWLQAGNAPKAEEALVSLKNRKPKATVRVGEQEVKMFEQPGEALVWLKKMIGERQLFAPREASQWAMFRGDTARNAHSAGSPPLLSFRWRVPTVNDTNDEIQVQQAAKKLRDQNWAALPGLHPLVVQDYVLMRTPSKVVAVNFQNGKRVWEYPWMNPSSSGAATPVLPGPAGRSTPQRETELSQRLWEDAAYGQLASDGDSVFLLDGLGYAFMNPYGNRVFIGAGGRLRPNPGYAQNYNELVALSIKKEGKLLWAVGGEKSDEEPRLAGAFFLGPPLPLHGSLYILAEVNSEIRLVVLNAKNGSLEWSQQLAHVDNRTILVDVVRRLAGATPSYADGVLVCPTSAGAVVAVDISTRSLMWGYQYEQNRQDSNNRFGIINGVNNQQRGVGNRWADATAAIADGRVLLTPVESDKLYCLDLATGKLVWPAQKRVDGGLEHLYLGGIKDGKAILVGKSKVTAIKLADGTPAWSAPVDLSAAPSGRGFLSDKHYYVPTVDSKLAKIDVTSGKLAQSTPTGQVLGNLVCYKDEVISQGVDWLFTFYQNEPLRAAVAKRLTANPDDGEALARQAEIFLQDGKPSEAIRLLRRAHQLKVPKEGDSIRSLLVSTLLAALREDFASNSAFAVEVDGLVEQPSQRAELRRLMALGLLKTGQNDLAFEAFVKLAGLDDGVPSAADAVKPTLEKVDMNLSVRRDRWVQAQIGKLLAAADSVQRGKMDDSIKARLDVVLKADSPPSLRQFVDYFGAHPLADRARLSLARKLIDKESYLEAELLLCRVEKSPEELLAAAGTAEMARLLLKSGQWHEAADYYRLLATRFAETECSAGQTGKQLVEMIPADSPVRPLLAGGPHWLSGKAEVKESVEGAGAPTTTRRAVYPIRMRDVRGPAASGTVVAYDMNLNSLVFRDGLGKERLHVSVTRPDGSRFYTSNYSVLHGKSHGHLNVVSIGFDLVAVDSLRSEAGSVKDALLWRQDLSPAVLGAPGLPTTGRVNPSIRSVANPWGETRYIATDPQGRLAGETGPLNVHGICFQKLRELHCVDPLTGESVWVRDGLDPGSQLFGDDERIFVVPPGLGEATVLAASDGSLLGKRKVDPYDNRWTTIDGRVLAWTQTDKLTLRLADVWNEKDVWKREFPLGSRGCLVAHDEVAIFQPDGKFVLLSLVDDKPRIEATLEPENLLMSIHVLRSQGQYILATNRPNTRPMPDMNVQPPLGGNLAPMIVGRIYAFDRSTGKPQWQTPAAVELYGLPLDQPADLPVLTFLRHMTPTGRPGQPRTTTSSILCLDRRDGRILLAKDDVPQLTNIYSITGDPEKQTVSVQLPARIFNIIFTDKPAPPEPPAQTGEASSMTASAGGLGAKLGEAVFNVFGRGLVPGRVVPLPAAADPFAPPRAVAPAAPGNDPFAP